MHAKLTKAGIRVGCYFDNYVWYENGVKLYTKDITCIEEIPNFGGNERLKDAKGVDISKLKLSDEQLLNMIIDDYTTMSNEQKSVYEKSKANMSQIGCGIETLHREGFRGSGTMALLDQKYCPHQMFSDKVQSATDIGTNVGSLEEASWHAAGMMSVMHKTAPDADIVHYCVCDMDTRI